MKIYTRLAYIVVLGIMFTLINSRPLSKAAARPLFITKAILARQTASILQQVTLKPAVYPGGKEALHQFLANTILLPESAFQQPDAIDWIGTSATLVFQINEQGQATFEAAKSFKSLEIIPDKPEVRRAAQKIYTSALATMPLWQPALENGKPVSFIDSVVFSIGTAPISYAEYLQSKKESLTKPNSVVSTADLKTKAGHMVYAFMQKPPTFPGGIETLKDYLQKNSRFTTGKQNTNFKNSIIVQIIINETGLVENALISKSMGAKADAEAVRAIKAMPPWHPAKQGHKFIAAVIPLFLHYK